MCEIRGRLGANDPVPVRDQLRQRALPGSVSAARGDGGEVPCPFGVSTTRSGDIQLAVTEACANVVRHAYPGGHGDVLCECEATDDEIVIRVSDWGMGSDQPSAQQGLGLGIPLIERLSDHATQTRARASRWWRCVSPARAYRQSRPSPTRPVGARSCRRSIAVASIADTLSPGVEVQTVRLSLRLDAPVAFSGRSADECVGTGVRSVPTSRSSVFPGLCGVRMRGLDGHRSVPALAPSDLAQADFSHAAGAGSASPQGRRELTRPTPFDGRVATSVSAAEGWLIGHESSLAPIICGC